MKISLSIILLLVVRILMGQNKEIPPCLQQKIKENSAYLGLYLAEIEGEQLYYLKKAPLPGADRINTVVFYDENCNKVNSSSTGGYTGRPRGYKSYNIISTLWEKEIFPMKTLSNSKIKLEYLGNYKTASPFQFMDHQHFYFSFQHGLQLLGKNNKIVRIYKIIPIKTGHYSSHSGFTEASEDIPENACLFEYNEGYWLMVAEDRDYFNLLPADKEGNRKGKKSWIAWVLVGK